MKGGLAREMSTCKPSSWPTFFRRWYQKEGRLSDNITLLDLYEDDHVLGFDDDVTHAVHTTQGEGGTVLRAPPAKVIDLDQKRHGYGY